MEQESLVSMLTALFLFKHKFSNEKSTKIYPELQNYILLLFLYIKFHQNPHYFVRKKELHYPKVWLKPCFYAENSFDKSSPSFMNEKIFGRKPNPQKDFFFSCSFSLIFFLSPLKKLLFFADWWACIHDSEQLCFAGPTCRFWIILFLPSLRCSRVN